MPNKQVPQSPSGSNRSEETKGTEEIVRQHMEDENHVITDQDIMNVEVGKFENEQEYEGELSDELPDASEDSEDDKKDAAPPNPWDIVQ